MQTSILSGWCLPVLVSASLLVSCSHKLAPEGHYQTTPMVTDGRTDDWPMPLRFSNASYSLQYNVVNDDNNLYICVTTRDAATQLRVLRSGMTLWFDPKGEKNKTIGLYFPIRKQPDPGSNRPRSGYGDGGDSYTDASRSRQGYTDIATREAELLLQSNYYNTSGFLNLENGQFGVTDSTAPIRVAIKKNDQDSLLVYEVRIPIKHVLGPDWKNKAGKKNFSVGIVLNAVPGTGGGGGGYSPRPMGMRGMRGGGHHYGGGGVRTPSQKEEADWYALRLATR